MDMAVVRFLPTGEIDDTFRLAATGAGAVVTGSRSEEGLASVLLDDRYLVAGGAEFAVAALDFDGKLRGEVGDSGWARPAPGFASAMTRSGSSLYRAGVDALNDANQRKSIVIVKLGLDGTLDTTFGQDGVARLTYDLGSYVWPELEDQLGFQDGFVRVNGVAELEDGALLVHTDAIGFLTRYPLLLKVTAEGTLDTSFGQNGAVAFPIAMPLLAGAVSQPGTRLATRGGLAWIVDEGVFSEKNRGFMIRVELDRL